VATEPGFKSVVFLTLVAGLDVFAQIGASTRALANIIGAVNTPLKDLLENGSVVDVVDSLSQEFRCGVSQDKPILLEDTEVCAVASLSVTCKHDS
jgi:hypothetical protein